MKIDSEDEKRGVAWLYGAGLFALVLSCVLAYTDRRMQTSDSEARLGRTLRELRTAQAALTNGSVDPRALHFVPNSGESPVETGE